MASQLQLSGPRVQLSKSNIFHLNFLLSTHLIINYYNLLLPVLNRYQTKVQSGGSGPKKLSSQGQPRAVQLLNPNRLKIIGGTAKGKKIDSPDVYLRPMMAKVCVLA